MKLGRIDISGLLVMKTRTRIFVNLWTSIKRCRITRTSLLPAHSSRVSITRTRARGKVSVYPILIEDVE
jgi:hypothetical protein